MCPKKNTLIPIAHFNQLIIQCISLCFMAALLDRKLIYHRLHILYIDYVLLHL